MALVNARHLLIKARTKGIDPIADAILEGSPEHVSLYEAARAIWGVPVKKNYVESSMLAENDLEIISELLEIDPAVLDMYRAVFFDVKDFSKLDKLCVIAESDNPEEASMRTWALSQGLDFLAWRLGKSVNISPVEGLRGLFNLSVMKSKEAMFSGNDSESSREAVKWVKMSADLGRLMKAWLVDSHAARSDIELALKMIKPEFTGLDDLIEQDSFDSLEDLDK